MANAEPRAGKYSDGNACRGFKRDAGIAEVQQRQMPGAHVFNAAVSRYTTRDQRCELVRQAALGENAIRTFHHEVERRGRAHQITEGGVKLNHQHRSSQTLAGDIAKQKVQVRIDFEKIAVIAAE